jgi:hypothetical protein
MGERPPIWKVAAGVLNKKSRTHDKEWSSSLEVRRDANNSSPQKLTMLRNISQRLGLGLIIWYNTSRGKGSSSRSGSRQEKVAGTCGFEDCRVYIHDYYEGTDRLSTSRTDVKAAREEELILEERRVPILDLSFHQQIGLKFKKETSEMLYLEHSFIWC